jgi:hypothetical protein
VAGPRRLFAPVEAAFDLVTVPVVDRVERRWSAAVSSVPLPGGDLVVGFGHDRGDVLVPQDGPVRASGVRLVPLQPSLPRLAA